MAAPIAGRVQLESRPDKDKVVDIFCRPINKSGCPFLSYSSPMAFQLNPLAKQRTHLTLSTRPDESRPVSLNGYRSGYIGL